MSSNGRNPPRETVIPPATQSSVAQLSRQTEDSIQDLAREIHRIGDEGEKELSRSTAERTRGFTRIWVVQSFVVVVLLAFVIVLFLVHRTDISKMQSQIHQRSQDRITSSEVMHLFNMHASQPHAGAVSKGRVESLERQIERLLEK